MSTVDNETVDSNKRSSAVPTPEPSSRRELLSSTWAASFRSFDYDSMSFSVEKSNESSCKNCFYVCTTPICPLCGTFNSSSFVQNELPRRSQQSHQKLPPKEAKSIKTKKTKKKVNRKKSSSKSKSQNSHERTPSPPKYDKLHDDEKDIFPSLFEYAFPVSREPKSTGQTALFQKGDAEASYPIDPSSNSDSDRSSSSSPFEYNIPNMENMDPDMPLRGTLSPMRQGFHEKNKFQPSKQTPANRISPHESSKNHFNNNKELAAEGPSKGIPALGISNSSIYPNIDDLILSPPFASSSHQQLTTGRSGATVTQEEVQGGPQQEQEQQHQHQHQHQQVTMEAPDTNIHPSLTKKQSFLSWSDEEKNRPWVCKTCTFENENALHLSCSMCGVLRGKEPEMQPLGQLQEVEEEPAAVSSLHEDSQLAAVRVTSQRVEEEWFAKLQEQRMEELVALQARALQEFYLRGS